MTTGHARRLWRLLEPYHAATYFAPEARQAFKDAGLRGFWMGYFAGRAAPMGAVGPGVVPDHGVAGAGEGEPRAHEGVDVGVGDDEGAHSSKILSGMPGDGRPGSACWSEGSQSPWMGSTPCLRTQAYSAGRQRAGERDKVWEVARSRG